VRVTLDRNEVENRHPPPFVEYMGKRKTRACSEQIFLENLYDAQVVSRLAQEYASALPYPHTSITPVCHEHKLINVLKQLESHLTLSFKETDLFKVLQSTDLASIDSDEYRDACHDLLILRDSLYSEKFRDFIQKVTNCPPLASRVDCSCNVYPQGGHLLCHDDVIGSRCISYIIYLSDPCESWKLSDGGALELYSTTKYPNVPATVPSGAVLPQWNSMLLFRVEPGRSFHSVQEVYAKHKSRISISGWYHLADPSISKVEHASATTLFQRDLVLTEQVHQNDHPRLVAPSRQVSQFHQLGYSPDDRKYLEAWINHEYLSSEGMIQLEERFRQQRSMILHSFLKDDVVHAIKSAILSERQKRASLRHSHSDGFDAGWVLCGPPHVRRFFRFQGSSGTNTQGESADLGNYLTKISEYLFKSKAFGHWLTKVVTRQVGLGEGTIRRFRSGLDYTVALPYSRHYDNQISLTLCFVDDFDIASKHLWSSGDVGGYTCHMTPCEERNAAVAEVYEAEDDASVLSVDPSFNTLSIIDCAGGGYDFVKFLSTSAPSDRWDISLNMSSKDA